ncbi:MAG: signal peptidase II [Firmicutes bacterium]|nr:signal peptidase II [Bacillota bacterium]
MLAIAILLLFDQGTKWFITHTMTVRQSIPIIKNVFHITYVRNPGAAFSLLANRTSLLIVVVVIIIIIIMVILYRLPVEDKLLRVALTFLLAGALGNLIDRIRFGYVIDFLDLRVWPVFNVADIAIFIGIGLLLLDVIRTPREKGI